MNIISIWPRGYAHETGPARLVIPADADPARAARAAFGMAATVFSVRPANPPKPAPVSEAYASMMSQKDNS